jgi:hypothetical protein
LKVSRRFTPPWTIDEAIGSFCIRDANKVWQLGHVDRNLARLGAGQDPSSREGPWRAVLPRIAGDFPKESPTPSA